MVVLFGSGVGACVVTDPLGPGRAIEWGHLTVRVRGRRRRCGARGCLEAYAGAEALLDRWREAGGRPPAGADEETALTAMLAAAYPAAPGTDPDATALAVLEETAEYLGAGFADLINLFQPERILVGGWAGLQLGARFLETVKGYAKEYALAYPAARVAIDMGTLGPDAVTVGAAILPLADFFARGGRRAETDPPRNSRPGRRRYGAERRTELVFGPPLLSALRTERARGTAPPSRSVRSSTPTWQGGGGGLATPRSLCGRPVRGARRGGSGCGRP